MQTETCFSWSCFVGSFGVGRAVGSGNFQGLRVPLKIQFGVQANLFDSGRRQEEAALASTKADLPSLPECKNLLLVAQKQLIERP